MMKLELEYFLRCSGVEKKMMVINGDINHFRSHTQVAPRYVKKNHCTYGTEATQDKRFVLRGYR